MPMRSASGKGGSRHSAARTIANVVVNAATPSASVATTAIESAQLP